MKGYPEKKSSHSDTMGVINGELTCFSPEFLYYNIPYTQNLLIYRLVGCTTAFLRQVGKTHYRTYIDNQMSFYMTYSDYSRKLQLHDICKICKKLKLRKILY
jgi:hypothetical protein